MRILIKNLAYKGVQGEHRGDGKGSLRNKGTIWNWGRKPGWKGNSDLGEGSHYRQRAGNEVLWGLEVRI